MSLKIDKKFYESEEKWAIFLEGEVDIVNAAELRGYLQETFAEKPSNITLELSDLSYIDSTGLGVIIGSYGRMAEKGFHLTLENPRENVRKLLHITSLDKIFLR